MARALITWLVSLLLVAVSAAGQESPVVLTRPAILAGVVRDDAGRPVSQARAYLTQPRGQLSAISGDDGSFECAQAAQGVFDLSVEKPGYVGIAVAGERRPQTVVPVSLAAGERRTVTLRLDRTAGVSGIFLTSEVIPSDTRWSGWSDQAMPRGRVNA